MIRYTEYCMTVQNAKVRFSETTTIYCYHLSMEERLDKQSRYRYIRRNRHRWHTEYRGVDSIAYRVRKRHQLLRHSLHKLRYVKPLFTTYFA